MKKTRNTLLLTKTDVANILNVSLKHLERTMTKDLKGLVGWEKGLQKFSEVEIMPIIARYLTMNTPQQNIELVRKYTGRN
jgi:hypothetical protein